MVLAMIAPGGPARAASLEEAKRIVDRAEPLQCEVAALEARLKGMRAGTDEFDGIAAEIEQARARLKLHHRAHMIEYIDVMKQLPFEERKAVYRYSEEMAERCMAKACGAAPCPAVE
ncbi:MAG TPA: hypothetical protein VMN03_08655 [Burkholderiales bacterium]|nr:hypothetical protein [Burkholderiales bacterium]